MKNLDLYKRDIESDFQILEERIERKLRQINEHSSRIKFQVTYDPQQAEFCVHSGAVPLAYFEHMQEADFCLDAIWHCVLNSHLIGGA